jgi:DNA-binding LacI/PurR family transcriptional regulator
MAMGAEAARLLLSILQGADAPRQVVRLPVSLIVRGSTGPAPRPE